MVRIMLKLPKSTYRIPFKSCAFTDCNRAERTFAEAGGNFLLLLPTSETLSQFIPVDRSIDPILELLLRAIPRDLIGPRTLRWWKNPSSFAAISLSGPCSKGPEKEGKGKDKKEQALDMVIYGSEGGN